MAGLTEIIKEAGIVGCGGAGFPTHAKYSGGPVETIIVNGAECEPLLQTDRYLMRNCARKLIRTADRIKEETGAKEFIIALKAAYTREIESLERAIEELGSSVKLHKLQSFFPAGDEQTIVYEVTGRVVPPAAIPLSVGCVVSNVATIYGIGDAFEGEPFTRKFLTVTGEVAHPTILRVPVGTPGQRVHRPGGRHASFEVYRGQRRSDDGKDDSHGRGSELLCDEDHVGTDRTSGGFRDREKKPGDGKAHDQSGKICLHPVFLLLSDVSESAFGTSDPSEQDHEKIELRHSDRGDVKRSGCKKCGALL